MAVMQVFDELGQANAPPLHDEDAIRSRLKAIGVRLAHWRADRELAENATQEEILMAYRDYIDELNDDYGFDFVDVSALWPAHPKKRELRAQFAAEHTHRDDELRFFVDGSGIFYFHVDEQVYAVLCGKGDLISVPAGTRHWFDMGENPQFTLIRFFPSKDGWVAENTGDGIADRLPCLDTFTASLKTVTEHADER